MSTNGAAAGGTNNAAVGALGQPGPPRHPPAATQAPPPLYQPPQLAAMRRPCSTYDPYRPNGSGPSSSSSSPSMMNATLNAPEASAGVCRLSAVNSGASNSGSSLGGGAGVGPVTVPLGAGAGGGKKRRLEGDGSGPTSVRTFNATWLMDASFAPWLRYDKDANRMFCRFCEKFERSERNQFSTSGSVNFRVSALKDHANSRTHSEAAISYNKTMMSSSHHQVPQGPTIRGWDEAMTLIKVADWMSKEEVPFAKFPSLCELLCCLKCPTMPNDVTAIREFMRSYMADKGHSSAPPLHTSTYHPPPLPPPPNPDHREEMQDKEAPTATSDSPTPHAPPVSPQPTATTGRTPSATVACSDTTYMSRLGRSNSPSAALLIPPLPSPPHTAIPSPAPCPSPSPSALVTMGRAIQNAQQQRSAPLAQTPLVGLAEAATASSSSLPSSPHGGNVTEASSGSMYGP